MLPEKIEIGMDVWVAATGIYGNQSYYGNKVLRAVVVKSGESFIRKYDAENNFLVEYKNGERHWVSSINIMIEKKDAIMWARVKFFDVIDDEGEK